MATYPKIVFKDVEFSRDEVLKASLVSNFDQFSVTVPVSTLELTLYSDSADFAITNPSGKYESLLSHQPMALYEHVNGQDIFLGQYYLDTWESVSENVGNFSCFDILGLLDKIDYYGGVWLTPTTFEDIIAAIIGNLNIEYVIDPVLAAETLTGWLPISSYREALQQVAFATSSYVKTIRENGIVFGRMSTVEKSTKHIRTGVAVTSALASTVRQWDFRSRSEFTFSSSGYVTQGIRSGVSKAGQSRTWKKRWRPSQWEGIRPTFDIDLGMQGEKPSLKLRPSITGIEVTMHNLSVGDGDITAVDQTFSAGNYEILFSQPLHTLTITGGTITESGANYAKINVATPGSVLLTGKAYVDTREVYGMYDVIPAGQKENILSITNGTMVSSDNGKEIAKNIYNYEQQRYAIKTKLFQPFMFTGDAVNIQTHYQQTVYGTINSMDIDLAAGFLGSAKIVGIII